ncbi:MAG TPA: hypothetical protein H9821_03790 [Candidatus Rothia avicola]|uniref:Uncharacterized protein n=1 Tax=Candidatus Rothia avicola TaxID=2840478 RepID=A0A9D2CQP2_9MICC|nr:hypothetical protein [Candidatus Rothia avicola]
MSLPQVLKQTQVSELEAHELMSFLSERGVIRAVSSQEWGWGSAMENYLPLSSEAEEPVSIEVWIRERAHDGGVTATEVAQKYEVERLEVTALLRKMREQNLLIIDPDGPQRGPNTRWVAVGDGG